MHIQDENVLIILYDYNVFFIQYSWINSLLKWHLTIDRLEKFGPANELNINCISYIIMQRSQSPVSWQNYMHIYPWKLTHA